MENFAVGLATSILGGIILAILGKWQGWWLRSKSEPSIDLATRTLKILDGDAGEKTNEMVNLTKQLGDSLVAFYKTKTPYKEHLETEALFLLNELLDLIKPISTELSAANPELDELKRAVNSYQKGLEWRSQIIKHLCHPPNPPAMDPGHVRDQLLSKNLLPHELLKAAQGEAAIFLRGHGVNWFKRQNYRRDIVKKHRAKYKEAVAHDYRSVLQQTSLHKARK
ncbi:hypothetical protein [Zhongshania arctica]|uniref:Uncharacterized protein n=1 Tax=Zhongshania arctica TaxID=3238302 RepID=A0ABV3TX19_9GAMM